MAIVDQDWLVAAVYLGGLVWMMLLISAISMRATRMRKAISQARD